MALIISTGFVVEGAPTTEYWGDCSPKYTRGWVMLSLPEGGTFDS